ncbi:MAG: hypothetical protein LBL98_03450 [Ruminococcus sp.]|jgi:hypothetical protein|nr:hypothetical protein [Ruminococcus sp.]
MNDNKRQLTEDEALKVSGGAGMPQGYDEIIEMLKKFMEAQEDANKNIQDNM